MFKSVRKEIVTIPAQMSYLSQVRDFIEQIGRRFKFSDKIINSFKLVVDEACTNVIRHGYRDVKGGEIILKAIIRRQSLTIVMIDQGISYDPRQATTPDLAKYIQIGKKGGLGILMMKKLMDDVQYNITSRGNELRLTKQRELLEQTRFQALWGGFSMRTRYSLVASAILTVLALLAFSFIFFSIDANTYEDVIENSKVLVTSLADNSSAYVSGIETFNPKLFEMNRDLKKNNPGQIYEVFIVDSSGKKIAASETGKALGYYIYPENKTEIEDTSQNYAIYKYEVEDSLVIFDFIANIYPTGATTGPAIGFAHIWVPESYIDQKASRQKFIVILWLVGFLVISYVLTYYLIDRIVKPFHSLADWVRQVGQGTVDEDEIDIDASDELGEIAQAFNQMTYKFREAQVNLIEQQRLKKELQVAQEIQQMLLPGDFPQVEGYDIASFYEAAKEVGGDLFDFVEVDNDTIGICVADVAGKGVPGSLIMTMIRTALRLEARGNKNPAEVLSKVNRFVTDDMKRGMFVTMFYLVLDSRNRIIHYASAGHNPMILYRGSSKQTYYLNPSGFPVGIQLPDITLFDRKIEQDSIRLREDDLLVLYTDGITEAMNPKRELFREERFLDSVRNYSHLDLADFVKSVKNDLLKHTQGYPQNDDITYVAIKEKLMRGEVIFNIQRELFRLIEEEGIMVKDACAEMRVSPYMYRKYKKIKDLSGWEGLKEEIYEADFIEKRHLSIETKTKIYEVIRENPEFGAKKISDMLNTEKYSFTKVEPRRIYDELKHANLSTKEKRENFVQRGGKKRIKLPGTPLLTMDGKVILDFESSESAIPATSETEQTQPVMRMPSEPSKAKIITMRSEKKEKERPPVTDAARPPVAKKEEAKPKEKLLTYEQFHALEKEKEQKAATVESRETKPKAAPVKRKKKALVETAYKIEPETIEAPVKDIKQEKIELAFNVESLDIDRGKLDAFYDTIKDDLQVIHQTQQNGSKDHRRLKQDLKKISLTLAIVIRNPYLKELGLLYKVFDQVVKGIELLTLNADNFDEEEIVQNTNEILKYIEKENILAALNRLYELINELGIRHSRIKMKAMKPVRKHVSEMDLVRKKIAQKKLLKNLSLVAETIKSPEE
jgi:serine phosphatase RsbU (regulator of sigma subunit)/anti-sigma regulatory factor (Ser/Thr protein kinase)